MTIGAICRIYVFTSFPRYPFKNGEGPDSRIERLSVMPCNPRMDIRCMTDERALLGESPVWSPEENAVYWIDILGRKLRIVKNQTKQ